MKALKSSIAAISPAIIEGSILLLAFLTRFWRLGYHSIWFDESVSLKWAGSDIAYTWANTFPLVHDKHPPVYYISLGLWQELLAWFGQSHNDAALRAFGSLLGVLTVWGLMRLASGVSGRATGYLAALLVALSPVLTWYSQELRMFQPATTGIVWGAAAISMASQSKRTWQRWGWWLLMIVAFEAALYSYLFSAFALPAAGLTLLIIYLRKRDMRRFVEGACALLATGLIFLPLARNAWSVNDAESSPGQPFADFIANLLHLLRIDTIWRVDWMQSWITVSLILFALLLLTGLLLPWRDRSAGEAGDRWWLWLWIGIPLLIANVLLARSHSIFAEDRYLIFMVPFALWAVARGAIALGSWWQPAGWTSAALALLALLLALPFLWTPARARENWRLAAEYIDGYTEASPGLHTSVVTHIDYTHEALEWYLRQRYDFKQLPVFFPFGGTLSADDVEKVIAPPLNGIVEFGSDTLWLTQSHLEGVDDNHLVEAWLTRNFPMITELYPAGVKLTGYILQDRLTELPALGPDACQPNVDMQAGLLLAACEVTTPVVAAKEEFMHPPSGWVHVRIWWHPTSPHAANYLSTAQVVGPQGVWGDKLPRETETLRMVPTSSWIPGEFVRDEADINLNPLTPPGTYPVMIGLVDPQGVPTADAVECGSVEIR